MNAWFLRGFLVVAVCLVSGCGGSSKKPDAGTANTGKERDSGDVTPVDSGVKTDAGTTAPAKRPDAGHKLDAGMKADAGHDSGMNPFDYDAAGDYHPDSGAVIMPMPTTWSCPAALWNDGHCDCGCSTRDIDCRMFSCIDPGCVSDKCDACFTLSGSWKPCTEEPLPADWKCNPAQISDGNCDCGCGIPDPDCQGNGCVEPGCYVEKCQVRHGCGANVTQTSDACSSQRPLPMPVPLNWPCAADTMPDDCRCECENSPPKPLTDSGWKCAWAKYGSGDGCDCGCGALDPDCLGKGCTGARCFEGACEHCADEQGRPYGCDAAQAGWDDDIIGGAQTKEPSQCASQHFGAGMADGCDCGCGGHDPDCGDDHGCDTAGCAGSDKGCARCTDNLGNVIGCVPELATWQGSNHCKPENYGTGDGCDCGCGIPDPDCGGNGCTTPGCQDSACDVCNDGAGMYVQCPGWVCTDPLAFTNAECDCGCGVIDPFCRDLLRHSCSTPGCETAACDHCNDSGHVRTACGGGWQSGSGNACNLKHYGIDGQCDCGCGVTDPDCADAEMSCTGQGCSAPACEVCHNGTLLSVCLAWRCGDANYGTGDGCDCGCGAPDPDCGVGAGCSTPGCKQTACKVCHDPFGRVLPCP